MRLGAFKYLNPLRYMGTKLLANAFHDAITPRPMPKPRRVKSLAEWRPVFDHAPGRPAMVKRDGGLRGSKARWRG